MASGLGSALEKGKRLAEGEAGAGSFSIPANPV